VTASLQELRGQDEPVSTAIAAFGAGSLETALGRRDGASRHLYEARDLAHALTQREAVAIAQNRRDTGTQTS
jgi:hypothetical protein